MNQANIVHGDILKWAAEYEGEPFHSLLADPPYHLTSIVKRFGGDDNAPAAAGVYARQARGFMGQEWDGGDIAFKPETWAALAKHLYPGAFLMAFCGSAGWHRQAVAMEDAGLIMHPSVFMFGYCFGSGFPKATRVNGDDAFVGHRYGRQAMKPALEPILLFQKPYSGRPLDCIVSTGAGTLNIDLSRVGTSADSPQEQGRSNSWNIGLAPAREGGKVYTEGRWPSNLILGDPESAAMLDRQSGISSENRSKIIGRTPKGTKGIYGDYGDVVVNTPSYPGDGGASRFFFQSTWNAEVEESLQNADGIFYTAKCSTGERNSGLDGFEARPSGVWEGRASQEPSRQIGNTAPRPQQNTHPTLKPLRLTRYLASLLLPPDAYAPRRILVPFAGVASECIGAMLAGWEEVVGIEQSEEYVNIGRQRIRFWSNNSGLFDSLTEEETDTLPQQSAFEWEQE